MKKTMIIISGMPATGKTTFATWLSSEICVPLLCRDRVLEKYTEIAKANFENLLLGDEEQKRILGHSIPSALYWFLCEEIMKSSSPLIIEFGFYDQMKTIIDELIEKYNYQTINVHFDSSVETAHRRFNERRKTIDEKRKEIPFEHFVKTLEQEGRVKESKNFCYGDCIINVDTTDFSMVSYEGIAKQIRHYTSRTK